LIQYISLKRFLTSKFFQYMYNKKERFYNNNKNKIK